MINLPDIMRAFGALWTPKTVSWEIRRRPESILVTRAEIAKGHWGAAQAACVAISYHKDGSATLYPRIPGAETGRSLAVRMPHWVGPSMGEFRRIRAKGGSKLSLVIPSSSWGSFPSVLLPEGLDAARSGLGIIESIAKATGMSAADLSESIRRRDTDVWSVAQDRLIELGTLTVPPSGLVFVGVS